MVALRSQSKNLLDKCLQNRLFPFLLFPFCKWRLFHGQKQLWEGCWGWFKRNSLCLDWSRCLEPTKVSISPFTSICDVSPWGLLNLAQMLVCACFMCPCGWGLGSQHGAIDRKWEKFILLQSRHLKSNKCLLKILAWEQTKDLKIWTFLKHRPNYSRHAWTHTHTFLFECIFITVWNVLLRSLVNADVNQNITKHGNVQFYSPAVGYL